MGTPINERSDGVLGLIYKDLTPLREAFERPEDPDTGEPAITGSAEVPDDLMSLISSQDLDDDPRVVGWEYTLQSVIRMRGKPETPRTVVISGLTVVFGPPDAPDEELVFRRYIDWADVWAQHGVSSGRGELDDEQVVLDPMNLPLPDDGPDQD